MCAAAAAAERAFRASTFEPMPTSTIPRVSATHHHALSVVEHRRVFLRQRLVPCDGATSHWECRRESLALIEQVGDVVGNQGQHIAMVRDRGFCLGKPLVDFEPGSVHRFRLIKTPLTLEDAGMMGQSVPEVRHRT